MRLLQSVLARLPPIKPPQHKFLPQLLGLLLRLPGQATCRHLSRDSPYHEQTFARWYGTTFACVIRNTAALTEVVPPTHQQALVMDARFVPKRGPQTYGLDRCWNGSQRRPEKG